MPNTREKPMGRLTLPHYGGKGHYMKCSEQFGCSGECADCEELDKIVERLAYYEDMIANGVTVQKWIPVTERLPETETEVMILAEHKTYSFKGDVKTRHIITTGMYEDGNINTEDSEWHWETDGFEYDEELDAHIIPEGWWEYKHYNGDDEYNHPIDDKVTHWMPLPEPPKTSE